MEQKCPICAQMFDEKKLADHLLDDHPGSYNPETEALHAATAHECPICHAKLPTPEALKAHNARDHRM